MLCLDLTLRQIIPCSVVKVQSICFATKNTICYKELTTIELYNSGVFGKYIINIITIGTSTVKLQTCVKMADSLAVKQTVKDSVFTDLFGMSKYLFQLYMALHPEDITAQESDLQTVTLENIFTDDIYNDLGFLKGDKLVVMIEAQSLWTSNIIIRALEYLVNSYRRYFTENNMDLYKNLKVALPRPEIYVIYTGNRKNALKRLRYHRNSLKENSQLWK